MKETKKYSDYRYSPKLMRRIEACAYWYAAEKPGIAEYAERRGVCVGIMAIKYVLGAIYHKKVRGHANTFTQALEQVEHSQTEPAWRRWGKAIVQLKEEYAAQERQETDLGALQLELTKWLAEQRPVAQTRIREIARSTGKLTTEQHDAIKYMIRSGKYKGVLLPTDLIYLIRTYLADK
jgi:hypothetical protein